MAEMVHHVHPLNQGLKGKVMNKVQTAYRCVADLPECVEKSCRHWRGSRCTWKPAAQERRTRGARLRIGKVEA
jgi:hypothetical protein